MLLWKLLISVLLLTALVLPTLASENFTSNAGEQWANVAETYRTSLSKKYSLPINQYESKCRLTINFGRKQSSATTYDVGSTTFVMNVYGPADFLQYNVIPHEVFHTVLEAYYKKLIPRWFDEGYATAIEPGPETRPPLTKVYPVQYIMNCKDYPPDTGNFYAQSESMVRYLLSMGGPVKLRDFMYDYLNTVGDYPIYLNKYYGIKSYQDFDSKWSEWRNPYKILEIK